MEKTYNFSLTLQEAQTVIAGIKKLPMENAEPIVNKLIVQYSNQIKADNPEIAVPEIGANASFKSVKKANK